jgi:hypothetical protein
VTLTEADLPDHGTFLPKPIQPSVSCGSLPPSLRVASRPRKKLQECARCPAASRYRRQDRDTGYFLAAPGAP